ncbi:unnamed protein product [Chondrus crispus]|uniref:Uncharacterized protein n=1 Tax=Chondrus crispus TaxID=2769 RepID=R7Q527_CHOCR|nr:unnamed protein product [Chondrus crispus]CDF32963.1 unnamed protein product [Chondrus crispus]|eukprot:XP_005712766.1 unnamed protein product [Chondrus crispus]
MPMRSGSRWSNGKSSWYCTINLPGKKNMIKAMHPPARVLANPRSGNDTATTATNTFKTVAIATRFGSVITVVKFPKSMTSNFCLNGMMNSE